MIKRILERLEEESDFFSGKPMGSLQKAYYCDGVKRAKEIVQEVANEHRKLNRCDTCTHYVADVVPPICYMCCKGIEDNYVAKE